MGERRRRLNLLDGLHQQGCDCAVAVRQGNSDFIETDARVAGGVFGEEGQNAVTLQQPLFDRQAPVVPHLDLGLVNPNNVTCRLQALAHRKHLRGVVIVPVR